MFRPRVQWALIAAAQGFTVTEIPIRQNPRHAGQGHYGIWNRLFASFYDLLAVRWMQKRMFRYEIAETTQKGL